MHYDQFIIGKVKIQMIDIIKLELFNFFYWLLFRGK